MMTDCVPDFNEMEDDYEIPTSSRFPIPKKPAPGEEDVMELMWQNGQVVVQKSYKKSSFGGGGGEAVIVADQAAAKEIRLNVEEQQQQQQQHLFMQEDEMASWLQYPMDDSFDRDFYTDLLDSAPPPPPPITTAAPPSIPLRPEITQRTQNFMHFSRLPSRSTIEAIPKPSVPTLRETTVVESNVIPAMMPESRVSHTVPELNTEAGTSAAAGEFALKRKTMDVADDNESEEIEFETTEAKKQAPSSSSTKRSRAAEVHNLSERRRRDRINEKMKALQELIPRCNKSDKASMLDEAIEYLKSLQMQVQMMSMGYGMVPMMYPGMQQYMPAMGMGMGMGIGMNRPIVPYPSVMPGSGVPNPAAAAHVGPRFPMPAFHLPSVGLPDPSRIQATNQTKPMLNQLVSHNSNQQQMPNFVDPYQQFLHLQQAQMSLQQNQTMVQPRDNNPSTSKNVGNPEHQQTG